MFVSNSIVHMISYLFRDFLLTKHATASEIFSNRLLHNKFKKSVGYNMYNHLCIGW